MTARETRRAHVLSAGEYIVDNGVLHLLVFTLDLDRDVLLVFANGWTTTYALDHLVELATDAEIAAAREVALTTGRGIRNFPNETVRPDGYAPATGHAVASPADTFQHDGRYDDKRGTDA